MTERLEATIRGDVQGVGFRWFVKRHAVRLGLAGWVSNEPDGSVRVVAEGPPVGLAELARLVRQGPSGAHVREVDEQRPPASGSMSSFEIRARGHGGD